MIQRKLFIKGTFEGHTQNKHKQFIVQTKEQELDTFNVAASYIHFYPNLDLEVDTCTIYVSHI